MYLSLALPADAVYLISGEEIEPLYYIVMYESVIVTSHVCHYKTSDTTMNEWNKIDVCDHYKRRI